MLCKKPYVNGVGQVYGCGQCLPCRLNRRRVWTHRIMLEAKQYDGSCFVTLTYDDEHLPGDGSLDPRDTVKWLKRVRKRFGRFRYFLVGEYGDVTWRPHYHAALFGFPGCSFGVSRYSKTKTSCCPNCDLVRDTWGLGNTFLGELNEQSAAYISGYVTKKLTRPGDGALGERYPEYARMSLKPGIGADAMWEVASLHMEYNLEEFGDVITGLRHGPGVRPLGRYLTRRLRLYCGKEPGAPQSVLDKKKEEMQPLLEHAKAISPHNADFQKTVVKNLIIDMGEQKIRQLEAKEKIFKKRGNQ